MTSAQAIESSRDPGVPEALPRVLIRVRDHFGSELIDRLWLFPPVRRARREQGLVAVSTFLEGQQRRAMVTVAYTAEHSGAGVSIETCFTQEGEAFPDRFPAVMLGVVNRTKETPGEAREVEISGSGQKFEELMEGFDAWIERGSAL
ncbi:MAG: hypothetical protein MK117_09215 [Gemmatimonadetes bacterium]|nr:hypothetical protein [Gemmatimonadota bacterium]MEC7808535.1 hypothetical protein [Gemmatimonadota bacterium]